jgi:hypothetical protein
MDYAEYQEISENEARKEQMVPFFCVWRGERKPS